MLQQLELQGYRGFYSHRLELRPVSVMVGQNNAGKSTLVEALRVLSVITERTGSLNFSAPPEWTDLPRLHRGVSPSMDGLEFQFETVSHHYGREPAEAVATFATGESVHLLVSPDGQVFAVLRDADGEIISTKGRALSVGFPSIQVLPQIQPLEALETILADDHYVRRNLSSVLASRHFRNQLRMLTAPYVRFRQLAEETWPGIQVLQLEGARGYAGQTLRLMIRDRDFVAEVGRMGHGLQMWLQTVWFLSRVTPGSTVVLDEPDVYMHADLQRRLIRLVRGMFPQVIVATHSVEIMAGVDPSEILVVDRGQPMSQFADTLPAVQALIDRIGGVHNVHLARLWNARRVILVEGDDLEFLKKLHDKLYPDSEVPLDDIPNSSIGGWGGWQYAIGQSMLAQNALGQRVRVYCIFDSDYHRPVEIQERAEEAKERQVDLHIWGRKEIENYFLDADVVARILVQRDGAIREAEVAAAVQARVDQIALSLEDVVFDGYSESFRAANPRGGAATANRQARELLHGVFSDPALALDRVSGKEVLKQLSGWSHAQYGRGITMRDLLREIRPHEVHAEVRGVISAIEDGRAFPRP